jgi:amidophosphoribosyltransferase
MRHRPRAFAQAAFLLPGKYNAASVGFSKLFLLMEKQHNRGQDGAGVACVKLDMPAGEPYHVPRAEHVKANPLDKIFKLLLDQYQEQGRGGASRVSAHGEAAFRFRRRAAHGPPALRHERRLQPQLVSSVFPPEFVADAQSGAVRKLQHDQHAELNDSLIAMGQHPIFATDTQAVLEKIGFFLDEEHEDLYRYLRTRESGRRGALAAHQRRPRRARVITRASQKWDGGYALAA